MTGVRREPRIAVMILAEASWQDANGIVLTVPARMEDKSASGACIRLRRQISVGARLKIHCRREQFSGTARYCRNVGMDYLVGIQRDTAMMAFAPQPHSVAAVIPPELPIPESKPHPMIAAALPPLTRAPLAPPAKAECVSISSAVPRLKAPADQMPKRIEEPTALFRKAARPEKKVNLERKSMRHKWLELPHWQGKQNGLPSDSSNGNARKGNHLPAVAVSEPTTASSLSEHSLQVELLPMNDLYRNAGILKPPKGYGINKVVEMIRSAHIRDLSKEMKRAAVLMALDSAGVAVEQVMRDATARQGALDSYEADQRKQLEAEWALKEEQNAQIEAELERVRAQYTARIGRNMDGIAREKASFESWLTLKRQESQAITEAADLCSDPEQRVSRLLPELSMASNDKLE
jgi:hypothetical protein